MTVQSLLRLCAELGIDLALKGDNNDRLVVDAPKGALTEALREALTEHKAALIAILKTRELASSRVKARTSPPQISDPMIESPAENSNDWRSLEAPTYSHQQSSSNRSSQFERMDAEVSKLLSGLAYDANTIDANDPATRQIIASQLLTALSGRNAEQVDCARRAFMNHGYFDDTTRQLRTDDSAKDRAAAARKLGIVRDHKATAHLVAALKDNAAEVRRAATEALGQIGDPKAIAPLEDLLIRETNSQLPEAVVRHALNSIAVTEAKKATAFQTPVSKPDEKSVSNVEPQKVKREIFAEYLSSFDQQKAASSLDSSVETAASAHVLEASVERLFVEEEALRKAAEDLEQRRLEAESARRMAEDEARIKAEHETQIKIELEARKRAEEETYRRMLAEAERQKAEEEARIVAEQASRIRAEVEARQRAEEEERFRQEAETLRKAAEDLAQKRAEAAAARKRAEDEEARR